jgi:hypothetical protein
MPSTSLSATPPPSSSYWQPQPSPVTPNLGPFDPTMFAPGAVAPFFGQTSLPFLFDTKNHQSLNTSQEFFQPGAPPPGVVSHSPLGRDSFLTSTPRFPCSQKKSRARPAKFRCLD